MSCLCLCECVMYVMLSYCYTHVPLLWFFFLDMYIHVFFLICYIGKRVFFNKHMLFSCNGPGNLLCHLYFIIVIFLIWFANKWNEKWNENLCFETSNQREIWRFRDTGPSLPSRDRSIIGRISEHVRSLWKFTCVKSTLSFRMQMNDTRGFVRMRRATGTLPPQLYFDGVRPRGAPH